MASVSLDSTDAEVREEKRTLTLRGAIFPGAGSMVGAGIFAFFGQAGAIAGAGVWVSFFVGGIIALLPGYSFAKLGARHPWSGGMINRIVRGYGKGLFAGGVEAVVWRAISTRQMKVEAE